MRLLGAEVVPVTSGSATLKDAVNEALRSWVEAVESAHYCLGSVVGPHPFPWMVRELQKVIGEEARAQCARMLSGRDPDLVVACWVVSNAIGNVRRLSSRHPHSELVGGGGRSGTDTPRPTARRRPRSRVLHGARSHFSGRDTARSPRRTRFRRCHDRPWALPEHAALASSGRARYSRSPPRGARRLHPPLPLEGIVPALETCAARAWVARESVRSVPRHHVLVTRSGRRQEPPGRLPPQARRPEMTPLETTLSGPGATGRRCWSRRDGRP